MERPDLNGLIAAIVTPMRSDASIDEGSLRRYADWLADQGVRGLAVNVDTGEGPHLFPEERLRVLEIVAEEVGGRARREGPASCRTRAGHGRGRRVLL